MKGLRGWAALVWVCCNFNLTAGQLAISPLTPLEMPPLTTDGWIMPRQPGVAVSGTNAVLYWGQTGGNDPGGASTAPFGVLNLFLSSLDAEGKPIDRPPKLALSTRYVSRYQPRLIPAAGSGFFAVFADSTDFTLPPGLQRSSNVFYTRISAQGDAVFEPVRLSMDRVAYEYRVAGNGQTLLYAESDRTNGIRFKLVDQNGGTVSSGAIPGSSFAYPSTPPAYSVVSDGNDYLLVWESSTAGYYLRFTSFAGDTGAYTTFYSPYAGGLGAVAPGKNGYLLLMRGGMALWLRQNLDRIVQADVQVPVASSAAVVYPEGEGWVVFTPGQTSYNSYRITPSFLNGQPHLTSALHLYPSFTPSADVPVENRIVPFGPGRYLLARDDIPFGLPPNMVARGVSILTSAGLTTAAQPKAFKPQAFSAFTASPFGYFAAWTEHGVTNRLLRGLRLAPDGSRIDEHSLVIADNTLANSQGISCAFDGNDYLIAWGDKYPISPHLARISPQGAPDIRIQSLSLPELNTVSLLVNQNQLFAFRSEFNEGIRDMHIWKISGTGEAGPEILVHGQYLVSDGRNIISIGVNDQLEVYRITVDPAAANPETSTNIVGLGTSATGVSLQNGFVFGWLDKMGTTHRAYFSDGQERLQLPPDPDYFADTVDRVLAISRPTSYGDNHYKFQTYNLRTGETAYDEADLGTIHNGFHVASAGKDFLAVVDSFGREMEYIGHFWIADAESPTIGLPRITPTGIQATLQLNPERRYRIDISTDLVEWNLLEVVGATSAADVTLPASADSSKGFVRAILVPE